MSSAVVDLHGLGLHGRQLPVADLDRQAGSSGDGGELLCLRVDGPDLLRVKAQLLSRQRGRKTTTTENSGGQHTTLLGSKRRPGRTGISSNA